MKDMDQADLGYLLEFIYLGEVAVPNVELERLITISRDLGIVGLSNALGEEDDMVDDKRELRAVKRKPLQTKRAKAKRARDDPRPSYDDSQDDHIFLEDYIDNTFDCDVDIGEACEDDESFGDKETVKKERRQKMENEDVKGEESDDEDVDDDGDNIPPDAIFATITEGITGKGNVYVINDYLYNHYGSRERKHFHLRCRNFKSGLIPCRASALIKKKTLQVVKFSREHSCVRDPDLRFEILAKNEMKELAETTSDSFRAIFEKVCLKYPGMSSRINFESVRVPMGRRRNKAISGVPIPGASSKKKEAKQSPTNVKSEDSMSEDTNNPLIGTAATMMAGSKGDSTLYAIGDYLYIGSGSKDRPSLHCRCRNFNGEFIKCTASALLDPLMLTVLKLTGEHSCVADPDLRLEIQAKNEMRELAGTTRETLKDVFDMVRLKYPSIDNRFSYASMRNGLKKRRMESLKDGEDANIYCLPVCNKPRTHVCRFPGCEKSYTDASSLRKHMKGVHEGGYKKSSHYDHRQQM